TKDTFGIQTSEVGLGNLSKILSNEEVLGFTICNFRKSFVVSSNNFLERFPILILLSGSYPSSNSFTGQVIRLLYRGDVSLECRGLEHRIEGIREEIINSF